MMIPRRVAPLVMSVDLGQKHDYTAVTVTLLRGYTDTGWPLLDLISAERWRDVEYAETCNRVINGAHRVSHHFGQPVDIWVDYGGVGQMPGEMIRANTPLDVYLAMITSGAKATHGEGPERRNWSVPRNELFWGGGSCINAKRLRYPADLPHLDVIESEMQAIQTRKTDAGNIKMEHVVSREAPNDDLVFSICLGVFGHQRHVAKKRVAVTPIAGGPERINPFSDRHFNNLGLREEVVPKGLPPMQEARQRALIELAKSDGGKSIRPVTLRRWG